MAKLRPPRNLDTYIPAADALDQLEGLLIASRKGMRAGDMLRWHIQFSRWNEAWLSPDNTTNPIVTSVSYGSSKHEDG